MRCGYHKHYCNCIYCHQFVHLDKNLLYEENIRIFNVACYSPDGTGGCDGSNGDGDGSDDVTAVTSIAQSHHGIGMIV